MTTTVKNFEIVWNVNHASLECKQGVYSIEETNETKDKGFLFNETKYSQVVDFETLKSLSHWSPIATFLMNEFTKFVEGEDIEQSDIDEYLEDVYDDETIYFYERKEMMYDGTSYMVYFPMEEEVSEDELKFAVECLDFTGKVIEKKGTFEQASTPDHMLINTEADLEEAKKVGYTMLVELFNHNIAKFIACDDYKEVIKYLTGDDWDESATLHTAYPINETFGLNSIFDKE